MNRRERRRAQKAQPAPQLPTALWVDANHEHSAWMRDAITRRIADVRSRVTPAFLDAVTPGGAIVARLVPWGRAGREDRTCDRCRTYVPPEGEPGGGLFYPLVVQMCSQVSGVPGLHLVGGFCPDCAGREYGPERLAELAPADAEGVAGDDSQA